jgi:hypothetical protein
MAELGVYARIHPKEWFSIHVGYNLIWVGNITRPHDNIYYNDNGPLPTPTGVVLKTNLEDMLIDGLMIGGEIRFK